MKKSLIIAILATVTMNFSSVAMAGKTPMLTMAPTPFYASIDDNNVVLTWRDSGFYRYHVDINIPQYVYTAHYSFSIDPSACSLVDATYNCSLNVPLSAFVWDTDANPAMELVPIDRAEPAKINMLDRPDKRDFNQENAFKDSDTFVLVTRTPLQEKNTLEHLAASREF